MPYAQRVAHGGTYFTVAAEYALALKSGAWVKPVAGMPLPTPGDAVIVGANGHAEGTWAIGIRDLQHEFTVTELGPLGPKGYPMESVNGGQPGVRVRQRYLTSYGDEWWAANVSLGATARPAKGKRLYGYTVLEQAADEGGRGVVSNGV